MRLADDKHAEMHLAQNVCPHSLKEAGSSKTSKQMEQMILSSGVLRKVSVGWPILLLSNRFLMQHECLQLDIQLNNPRPCESAVQNCRN